MSSPSPLWTFKTPYKVTIPTDSQQTSKPERDLWAILLEEQLGEDKERYERWRDEIQNLLTFTGLFSAVVATFVVDSYKNIQPDSQGNAVILLAQLVSHLAPDVHNNSISTTPIPPFVPDPSEVRVNVYWFLSLVVSLGTATAGITTLQWIREFVQYDRDLTSKQAFALRNLRAESLDRWHVQGTIATLPFLIQIALVLFLIGLCDFLFNSVSRAVAIPSAIISTIIIVSLTLSIILPTLQHFALLGNFFKLRIPTPCPYKSQLGWLYFEMVYFLTTHTLALFRGMGGIVSPRAASRTGAQDESKRKLPNPIEYETPWSSEFEWLVRRDYASQSPPDSDVKTSMEQMPNNTRSVEYDAARGLAFMADRSFRGRSTPYALYKCFHDLPPRVTGETFFERTSDAKAFPKTSVKAVYKDPDPVLVQAQNAMFFLNSFEQTVSTSLKHRFADLQLELCVRVLGGIFTARRGMPFVKKDVAMHRSLDHGVSDLWLPRILMNSKRNRGLHQLSDLHNGDAIREQLLLAFKTFVSTSKELQPLVKINTYHTFQQIVPFTETAAHVIQGILLPIQEERPQDSLQGIEALELMERRQRQYLMVEITGTSINNHFIKFLLEYPNPELTPSDPTDMNTTPKPVPPLETTSLFLASAIYIVTLFQSFKSLCPGPWYTLRPDDKTGDHPDDLDFQRPRKAIEPPTPKVPSSLMLTSSFASHFIHTPDFASSFVQLLDVWVEKVKRSDDPQRSVFGKKGWFQRKQEEIGKKRSSEKSSRQPLDGGKREGENEKRPREDACNLDLEKGLVPSERAPDRC